MWQLRSFAKDMANSQDLLSVNGGYKLSLIAHSG
jgi:hypothetical protein